MADVYDPSATSLLGKLCHRCGQTKPLEGFYKCSKAKDGLSWHCKLCMDACRKKRYQANREEEVARVKEWSKNNPEQRRRIGRNWWRAHCLEIKANHKRKYTSVPGYRVNSVYGNVKKRAAMMGVPFTLTKEWIDKEFGKGVCAVTGLAFDFEQVRGPLTPSLDRIDPAKGYTPENVQVVVLIYNLAKKNWYHEDVVQMAAALMSRTPRGANA